MRRASQRGAALIEFALVLPFLLVLTFMTTEFGRAMYEYNALTKSARDASRFLAVQLQSNTHVDEARNLAVYGTTTPGAGARPLASNLSVGQVSAAWGTTGSAPVINIVTVSITGYQFRSLVTTMFGLDFPAMTFPAITATMRSQNV